ncbi:MAG: sensor histidine kinase [Sandaracinaceae bacterium]
MSPSMLSGFLMGDSHAKVSETERRDADALFAREYERITRRTDRMFMWLIVAQWAAAIVLSLTLSPRSWSGATSSPHVHVAGAIAVGFALTAVPVWMVLRHPGAAVTRGVIAVVQMLWSGLLIHLSGGRIETHFHIFGSLALLAFYRDMRVLLPATIVTAADHFIRGVVWPESIYGVANPEWWRFLEHAAWVVFIDVFLVMNCKQSLDELENLCLREVLVVRATETAAHAAESAARAEEREKAAKEREGAQKLEAIGQLAAGIAHEINTPIQYVSDNTVFLGSALDGLIGALDSARELLDKVMAGEATPEDAKRLEKAFKRSKVSYLVREIPKALEQSTEGLSRVANLVGAMKEFSHPSQGARTAVDLAKAITTTVTVARNEWKYVAEVVTDLDPSLPPVSALRDELNQVFLNLIVNAAHAIDEKTHGGADGKGEIRIRTRRVGDRHAEVRIEDTGSGIPESIRARVFEPFFTTKEVGKGTGQGLAIARNVVVKKHGGTLDFESVTGQGTTFVIRLPLEASPSTREAAA